MFIQILSAIHTAGTLLFGIYCSAFFLGVKSNRKNILSLFLLFCVQGFLYLINSAFFGKALALKSNRYRMVLLFCQNTDYVWNIYHSL